MDHSTSGGPNGPQVSPLSLGALPFGAIVDEETSFAILDRFLDVGGGGGTGATPAFRRLSRHSPRAEPGRALI